MSKTPKWGKWYSLIESRRRRGQVIMEGLGKPLLVLDRVGKGRVAMLMSDHAWLWARGHDGGGPFTSLLRRIAHWSMKEPDLEEEYLKAEVKGHTLMIERRTTKEKATTVEIRSPVGKKTVVPLKKEAPGVWTAQYKVSLNGLYRLKSGQLKFVTHVGRLNAPEHTGVVAVADKVLPVLTATGGGVFWLGQANAALLDVKLSPASIPGAGRPGAKIPAVRIPTVKIPTANIPRLVMMGETSRQFRGSNWLGLKQRDAWLVKGIRLVPLLNGFLALALLLGFLSLTWWREGR